MNGTHEDLSGRGVSHAEANATTNAMNAATLKALDEPTNAEQIQVPRSPQPLSLRINGLDATGHGKIYHNTAYIESSERGSDTSVDDSRPELHSASTFTDSQNSVPSSSVNNSGPYIEPSNSHSVDVDSTSPKIRPKSPKAQHSIPINGNGSRGASDGAIKLDPPNNGSLSPSHSPKPSGLRLGNNIQFTPGHKRTATGDIKPISSGLVAPKLSDVNGASRRRSKSTGSPAYGSRIAQLSVHIRTRLSYAAAKIEKSRQSRNVDPLSALHELASLSSLSSPSPVSLHSAPSSNPTSYPQRTLNGTPEAFSNQHPPHRTISSHGEHLSVPKLAPPVDVISSSEHVRRRRPNPNTVAKGFNHSPYARHRRHHSHQEHLIGRALNGTPSVLGQGTSSISPTRHVHTSAQDGVYRSRTQSQSTSMEQDAIETLLFMSSPENSGYRSSPRSLQPSATQHSLNVSIYSDMNGASTHHSESSQGLNSQGDRIVPLRTTDLALEAHAGDEIDRILDQMDSDSEELSTL